VSEQTDIQTQRLQYFAPSWAKSLIYRQLQTTQGDTKMGSMSLTARTFKTPEPMCMIFDNFNAINTSTLLSLSTVFSWTLQTKQRHLSKINNPIYVFWRCWKT